MGGIPEFCKLSAQLAFGEDSAPLLEGRNATIQGLSGTGSLRVRASLPRDAAVAAVRVLAHLPAGCLAPPGSGPPSRPSDPHLPPAKVGAEFLSRFYSGPPGARTVYIPDPSWANHVNIMQR